MLLKMPNSDRSQSNSIYANGQVLMTEEEMENIEKNYPFKAKAGNNENGEQHILLNVRKPCNFDGEAKSIFD